MNAGHSVPYRSSSSIWARRESGELSGTGFSTGRTPFRSPISSIKAAKETQRLTQTGRSHTHIGFIHSSFTAALLWKGHGSTYTRSPTNPVIIINIQTWQVKSNESTWWHDETDSATMKLLTHRNASSRTLLMIVHRLIDGSSVSGQMMLQYTTTTVTDQHWQSAVSITSLILAQTVSKLWLSGYW